jgi:hypothetical protein
MKFGEGISVRDKNVRSSPEEWLVAATTVNAGKRHDRN